MQDPDAAAGFVAFETGSDDPVLKEPAEAQALAFNLLSAASKAQAQREAQDAQDERHAALGALVSVVSRLPDFKVGAEDVEDVEAVEGEPVVEYRRLWVRGPDVVGAWTVPAEDVPGWVESGECPGEPDGDALSVLMDAVDGGGRAERVRV